VKLLVALLFCAAALPAETTHIPKAPHPPKLDEFLAAGEVPGFLRVTDFRQNRPADGKPATRQTTAWLAWDQQNFYAAFLCREEPGKVRARFSRREDIFSDDQVALYLDTFHDRQRTFSFYANPFGIQADSINTEGKEDDYSFDTVWKSEGRLTPDGFAVLMTIPFHSLRFSNSPQQTWGIGVARFIPARNEGDYWPYYTSRLEGFARQLATADGPENISPGRNLQFIPYTTFGSSHFLDAPDYAAPQFRQKNELRGGLDSKLVIHDAFTLDITLNPDFSQVETNDPRVTVNQRFEVFFPEKRPFFLDNAAYFQTPENLFFSRRIANPEYGARLTGKAGGWLLGLLAIDDRAPGQPLAPDDPATGDHAVISVARVLREFRNQSTLGALFTDYRFAGSSESTFSLDTRLRLTSNLVFTGQAVRNQTRYSGSPVTSHGSIYHAQLAYSSLHFNAGSVFRSISPDFRSTLSYIPRVDIRQGEHNASWRWFPNRGILKAFGPIFNATEDWDHKGDLQDWLISSGVNFEFTGSTFVFAQRTEALEVFQSLRFRKHANGFGMSTELLKFVSVEATYGAGLGVNYDPAVGLPPFLASSKDANLHLIFRPTKKIKLDESYLFSHLSTLEKSIIAERYGPGAIFNNHLWRSNLNYQFTRELSFRAILDYNGILPNAPLINFERSKRFAAGLLFTWLLNPGTAVYAGYNNTHENLSIFPGPPRYIGRIGDPSTTTGREIFIKLSYLFRR
jgi:hypothetical protein